MNYCSHTDTIEDFHTGDEICLYCGLVIAKIMINDYRISNDFIKVIENDDDVCHLKKLCDKIPCNDFCFEKILSTYKNYRNTSKIAKKYLFAAAIFSTLNKENCSKSIEYISNLCSVKNNKFWKYLRQLDVEYSCNTKHMSEFFLQKLKLNYNDIKAINITVDKLSKTNFAPKTVLAVSSYLYLKKKNPKICVSEIAKILTCSSMSMYRCLNFIRNNL